jgi:hypothetical protein
VLADMAPLGTNMSLPRAHAQSGRLDARQAVGQLVQGIGRRVGYNFQLDTLDHSGPIGAVYSIHCRIARHRMV